MSSQKQKYVVFYYPIKETPPRFGGMYLGSVLLQPQLNTLTERQYNEVSGNPKFKELIMKGIIEILDHDEGVVAPKEKVTEKPNPKKRTAAPVVESPVEPSEPVSITNLSINNALTLIAAEEGTDLLAVWHKQELGGKRRKRILKTLEAKLTSPKESIMFGEQVALPILEEV